jgi:oxalate decarboxylase/phosphoglucose isomerase-like protein (cupin superfamily)
MPIDFSEQCGFPATYDEITHQITHAPGFTTEEIFSRSMQAMAPLYLTTAPYSLDDPLYYMYNGIVHEDHAALFKHHQLKYELTVLPPLKVGKEYNKAHGHIHQYHPIRKTRHVEAYEILHGHGVFQLFRYVDQQLQVIIFNVKTGDRFHLPCDYFHLSINTSQEPLIFGDLIADSSTNDYQPLIVTKGAPMYLLANHHNYDLQLNPNYVYEQLITTVCDINSLPWDSMVPNVPLYPQFLTRPSIFNFLKGL